MKKQILTTILILSAALFTGCNDDTPETIQATNLSTELSEVSNESRAFAKSIISGNEILMFSQGFSSQSSSSSTPIPQKMQREMMQEKVNTGTEVIPCENGGEMRTSYVENNETQSVSFTNTHYNCLEGTFLTNGKVRIRFTDMEGLENIEIKFLNTFTMEDRADDSMVRIEKDSISDIKMRNDGQDMIVRESMDASFEQGGNKETYKTKDLITHIKTNQNNQTFYFKSGIRYTNDEAYRVDEAYDASATPMVINENTDLLSGGILKFYNESNHHISLEAIAKNTVKISVDTDNDGKIDQSETIKLDE